ncbi:MAG: hydroxymethylglutaryl-CoA lyase [Alphaproteobacteria bacterium]|nr:hydroxymethylglutaryl-CoA lyase [Alphaproteobacteria bacterium SS10]
MTDRVTLVEVGPRDGLQNEPKPIDAATKITLVDRLAAAGLPSVEAGAFVSPKWVPQMAASDEVMRGIQRHEATDYPVLVPNLKGLEAAKTADAETIAIFLAASESFSQKNINCSIDESFGRAAEVIAGARESGLQVRAYISCVVGCPYEGAIEPIAVAKVAARLARLEVAEISLGDTIGVGTPGSVGTMLKAVQDAVPSSTKLAGHFHDTYGQSLANILTAMNLGIRTFDTSVAGLGGCPYAPGASGNVATEDVIYMLEGMGMETGADLDQIVDIGDWICGVIGRSNGSKVAAAKLAAR